MTYLEFTGEDKTRGVAESSKFWQVTREGEKLIIVFGKIGTNGQTTEKSFSTAEEASSEMEKLIKSKLKKGYKEATK
jgi:predicted DNA-binding WGR domain protein